MQYYNSKSSAMAAAASQGKLILMLACRDTCSNCKALKQTIIPSSGVSPMVEQNFVLWDVNIDKSRTTWRPFFKDVSTKLILPLLVILKADYTFVSRSSGALTADQFLTFLQQGVAAGNPKVTVPATASALASTGNTLSAQVVAPPTAAVNLATGSTLPTITTLPASATVQATVNPISAAVTGITTMPVSGGTPNLAQMVSGQSAAPVSVTPTVSAPASISQIATTQGVLAIEPGGIAGGVSGASPNPAADAVNSATPALPTANASSVVSASEGGLMDYLPIVAIGLAVYRTFFK